MVKGRTDCSFIYMFFIEIKILKFFIPTSVPTNQNYYRSSGLSALVQSPALAGFASLAASNSACCVGNKHKDI